MVALGKPSLSFLGEHNCLHCNIRFFLCLCIAVYLTSEERLLCPGGSDSELERYTPSYSLKLLIQQATL